MSSSTNPMKSSPPSSVVPDPTPFLFLVGATLAWFAIGSDAGPAWILTAVVALPFLIWLGRMLASRPESGVILLVAAAAMPRGFVEIGGLKARPEHLAVGLLCVAVPLLIRARHLTPQWILADYVLASYVAANLVSSLFMSVEPAQTLRWSLQQAVAILPYFFMRVVAGNFKALRWSFRVFLKRTSWGRIVGPAL